MKVEIIICTYNRAEKLKRSMQSIFNAEIPESVTVQLTVVNNNSIDKTENLIKGFTKNNLLLKYLFEEKQGKTYALNKALKYITGDLIAFTDDDITVDKSWIKEMVKALKKYTEYKCFGGKVVAVYPKNMPKWIDINGSMRFLKSVFVDRDDGNLEVEYGNDTISKTPGGCNMFFRRKAIEENGPFRIDLGPVGKELGFSEDIEYCHRLIEKGKRFMYIPSAIVYHPVHTERLKKEYLLNWQYRVAKSEVRRNGGYKGTAKVFGVPRYLYGNMIEHTVGWWLSPQSKNKLYHKLKLYYIAGEIIEHLRIKVQKVIRKNNSVRKKGKGS